MRSIAISLAIMSMELFGYGQTIAIAQDLTGMTPPKDIPEFIVKGNPSDFETFQIIIGDRHLMDFGWKYTGIVPKDENIKLPEGVDWRKRHVYFFAVRYVNKTDSYIRFVEGTSTGDNWIRKSDGTWKSAPPRTVKRLDILKSIDLYDVAPMADRVREDYYVYASLDGKEPYVSTRYIYYAERMNIWFAVTFIRTSP